MTLPVRYVQRERETAPRDWLELWAPSVDLAKAIANTDFVPKPMRGNPAMIAAAILYGDETGLGPMQALAHISIIEGKPTLSAETQRALILAAGHEIWIEDASNTRVTVTGRRRDSDRTVSVTWTMDDAKRAGIAGRHNWRAYPRQMLTARASAELARSLFADAIGGMAATEELEGDAPDAATGDAPATGAPTPRRRRSRVVPVMTSAPPAETPPPEAPPVPGDDATETGSGPQFDDERPKPSEEMGAFIEDASQAGPTGDDRPATEAARTRMNVQVGKLRDKGGHLTTEQIYAAIGTLRRQTPTALALAVGGVDDEGKLHWGPLRDSLTRGEARQLMEWFSIKESRIASEPVSPPVPGDEFALPEGVRETLQPPLPGDEP